MSLQEGCDHAAHRSRGRSCLLDQLFVRRQQRVSLGVQSLQSALRLFELARLVREYLVRPLGTRGQFCPGRIAAATHLLELYTELVGTCGLAQALWVRHHGLVAFALGGFPELVGPRGLAQALLVRHHGLVAFALGGFPELVGPRGLAQALLVRHHGLVAFALGGFPELVGPRGLAQALLVRHHGLVAFALGRFQPQRHSRDIGLRRVPAREGLAVVLRKGFQLCPQRVMRLLGTRGMSTACPGRQSDCECAPPVPADAHSWRMTDGICGPCPMTPSPYPCRNSK